MGKLAVKYVPIDRLIPYANNARTHSDAQIAQIAASIREFGFTNPILVNGDSGIIAGHGRVLAARKLGLTEVPTIELAHLTKAQRRAYIIADNKLALNAGWDDEMLRIELVDLQTDGFDLDLTGFSGDELATLLADKAEGLTDPDEVPEPPAEPVTALGDVWILGRHRLVCGDSTTTEAVDAALAGVKPHLMVTDPPYGVSYDPTWRDDAGGVFGNGKTKMRGKVENDSRADWSEAWTLFPGNIAYVWHGGLHSGVVSASLESANFVIRSQIIWVKSHFILSRGDYHWHHEPCWYAVRKGTKGNWSGDRKQTTVWQIAGMNPAGRNRDAGNEKSSHGTQKPVECMKRPIENNSSPGQAVYEPFSGSGTTIIAGELTARNVHAIELSPTYVDTAIVRWQNFTGLAATLEADGRSFKVVAAERATRAA